MRILVIALLLLTACGGSLTDDQRKRLKDGMKKNEIRKLSDAQITDAAFVMGRSISANLISRSKKSADSLSQLAGAKIIFIDQRSTGLSKIEKEIIEAYAEGSRDAAMSDNVQKLVGDSLLYTQPMAHKLDDNSYTFEYAIAIRMSKKQVIMSIKQ